MNGISTCKKSLVSFNRAVTSNKSTCLVLSLSEKKYKESVSWGRRVIYIYPWWCTRQSAVVVSETGSSVVVGKPNVVVVVSS